MILTLLNPPKIMLILWMYCYKYAEKYNLSICNGICYFPDFPLLMIAQIVDPYPDDSIVLLFEYRNFNQLNIRIFNQNEK